MEIKRTIMSLIFVAVVVLSTIALIVFTGITAQEYNYVQLEINPRVEFLCDKNFKVVSTNPLNEDAKIVLANLDYTGIDINVACVDFIDQCAQTGYIDINKSNALNLTVIDSLTQALDVHIAKEIFNYLKKNEILCAVIENYEDRSMAKEKKEKSIPCSNKLKLIKTINEQDETLKIDQLKKLSEVELIDLVNNIHNTQTKIIDSNYKIEKEKLLANNKSKYEKHKYSITNESQKNFANIFDNYSKLTTEHTALNFNNTYKNWQASNSF